MNFNIPHKVPLNYFRHLRYISKLQWFLILILSTIIFLSLGLLERPIQVYQTAVQPASENEGVVSIVFYGHRYKDYKSSGALLLPEPNWFITEYSDSTILTAPKGAKPLILYSEGDPILFGLIHQQGGGIIRLANSDDSDFKSISLQSDSHFVSTISIGGKSSDIPLSKISLKRYNNKYLMRVFASIFALLTIIVILQHANASKTTSIKYKPKVLELTLLFLPLFFSTFIFQLAYWPANSAYDGSLQWYEAYSRGHLTAAIGTTPTLLMRLFTYISSSPALLILFQSFMSALGIALFLKELRHKGVPRIVIQIFVIFIAITPQYSSFFTNLGKDALCAVGLIFMSWAILAFFRNFSTSRNHNYYIFIIIFSGLFAGLMRTNAMPAVIIVAIITMALLYVKGHKIKALSSIILFGFLALSLPSFFIAHSYEGKPYINSKVSPPPPFGDFVTWYLFQLFSAALNAGIPINDEDAEIFYKIAPKEAWQKHDCFMIDTTRDSVLQSKLMSSLEYSAYIRKNQIKLASVVYRLIKENPLILVKQQVCITKLIWYIGINQLPFQAIPTIGYDNVKEDFKKITGENRALINSKYRTKIMSYITWSQSSKNFWLMWKPALICYLGLFIVLIRLTLQKDLGLFVALSLPVLLSLVLMVVIPFPAYRYQYPAMLIFLLFMPLIFSTKSENR